MPAPSICRASHSRPFMQIGMENGNQVSIRAFSQPQDRMLPILLVGPQVSVQAKRIGDLAQRSPKYQPIESAQNSLNLACILRGKPGVPFLSYLVNFEHSR
jgi:hypothetical protein